MKSSLFCLFPKNAKCSFFTSRSFHFKILTEVIPLLRFYSPKIRRNDGDKCALWTVDHFVSTNGRKPTSKAGES